MRVTLLDVAFRIRVDHNVPFDPSNPFVDPAKARLHALQRRFPAIDPQEVEEAYRRAEHLLDVAIEMADLNRGPKNDGTGPNFDLDLLAERCPGFCAENYTAALNEGFMRTR